jgi:hypothetical protein
LVDFFSKKRKNLAFIIIVLVVVYSVMTIIASQGCPKVNPAIFPLGYFSFL